MPITSSSDNFDAEGQTSQTPLGTGNVDAYFKNDSTVPLSTFAVYGSPNNGSVPACPGPESGNCLNLAGAYDVSQVITRGLISLAAGTYNLTFLYSGSERTQDLNALDSAMVSLGAAFTKSFSIAPSASPQTFSYDFTLNSPLSANLVFTDTTPDPFGPAISVSMGTELTTREVALHGHVKLAELASLASVWPGIDEDKAWRANELKRWRDFCGRYLSKFQCWRTSVGTILK